MPHSVPKDEKAPRSHVPFWTADNLADTKEIPTYLFRLSTPRSDGETTETHVCPPEPQHENLLDLKRCVGADRLHKHLDWEREHKPICNFMSWSSSLLFLLQYAFFRHTNICDKFDDIKLLVIDTTKFPKGTFAKDMDLLKVFKTDCKPDCKPHNDIQAFVKRRNGRNYFGEYLTQGALNLFEGECIQASFKEMVDLGLFELLPEVLRNKQNWTGWANPVKTSRFAFSSNEYAQPISENEVDAAISIAKTLFKGPWSLPVATMLLGLKPRQRNDPIILRGFIDSYGGEYLLANSK